MEPITELTVKVILEEERKKNEHTTAQETMYISTVYD